MIFRGHWGAIEGCSAGEQHNREISPPGIWWLGLRVEWKGEEQDWRHGGQWGAHFTNVGGDHGSLN